MTDKGVTDLERHLQLSVVTKKVIGSYDKVYEVTVMVRGTVCAAQEIHPTLLNEINKHAFLSECVQNSRVLYPNIVQFLGVSGTYPRAGQAGPRPAQMLVVPCQ